VKPSTVGFVAVRPARFGPPEWPICEGTSTIEAVMPTPIMPRVTAWAPSGAAMTVSPAIAS
jgi:hypothetical protein